MLLLFLMYGMILNGLCWILFPLILWMVCVRKGISLRPCVGRSSIGCALLLVLGQFPIGEASNPGPAGHFDACFTLGAFNPSGLRNKAQFFQTHLSHGDVWAISETHFFGKDVSRFKAGLHSAGSSHKYCVTDRTSMRRGLTTDNSWKGVGVLAKHPTRQIPTCLPQPVLDSGRALMCASLIGDIWISGAVMYGEPNCHQYPCFLQNNEYLLHELAVHVCGLCAGPRYLAGDLNVTQGSLPAFEILHQHGFRDIQEVALQRWGYQIQNTCKGKTRKDFLFLSPELQELLVDVNIEHDVWPDHSVVAGQFRHVANLPPARVWPSPHAFPWPSDFAVDVKWFAPDGNMTEGYTNLWQNIEADAARVSPHVVTSKMCGRAGRMTPKVVRRHHVAPIKIGRQGDFQPAYIGTSIRHAQWVRQVRRLQSFVRLAASEKQDLMIPLVEAWSAILHAKGFAPSFAVWWSSCGHRTSDAPETCPVAPPSAMCAFAMFESVAMAVRNFEGQLKKQSREYAKFRRDQNPNLVFADVRPPMIPGVEVLFQSVQAQVEDVDEETGQVTLDQPCEFRPNEVISCQGTPLGVIHHEADALWVADTAHVVVGATVTQTKYVGDLAELERQFVEVWRDRWMRHADVPASRWNVIVDFAKRYLPRGCHVWPSLTPADISASLCKKKKSTSPGFDGVTLADLKRMPEPVLQAFCDMYAASETTGQWPSQLVEGKVVSLAKVVTPGAPNDFRPITVFGLLYRVWSSFHARRALQCLDPLLPDSLYGSRPGRYAAQVWAKLLWCIEHSFCHALDLSGLVADLQKAFNLLPRVAVFEIAAHMGLPGNMMVAWAGALSQMKRRFLLRGTLTKGIPSVTGFPEGCGLSCVAMLVLDLAFHTWHQVYFPLCTPISYVDDWQLICPNSAFIAGAKQCLDRFVQAVDLQLDSKKTYAWSITDKGRQNLRKGGFKVLLSAKNLGAHVQMSKRHTNASLLERIHSMTDLWPRLRMSACRYATKIRALLVAAWPRALHAVASTSVGDAVFHSLRTGAMKGISADGAGCNAWIHLGLVEHPLADPQFWSIVQTVRCARDCGEMAQVCDALDRLLQDPSALPANCITSTLLGRVQTLGWHLEPHGHVHDLFGSFHLLRVSMTELIFRAQCAWQLVVAQQVVHRPGLINLHQTDMCDTREFVRSLDHEDRELFHRCLNGSHITQDGKKYCQSGLTVCCPYCECSDSRFHRFWICQRFQSERSSVSPEVLAMIPSLPDYLTGYGWSLRPHTQFQWFRALCAIVLPEPVILTSLETDAHVFTDGSCLNQAFPSCRLASWAVVLADVSKPMLSQVVASGPLPGLLQSSYRAEVFAIWQALCAMKVQKGRVHLWTDCQAVVRKMQRIVAGHEPKPNSAHADLWALIFDCMKDFELGQVVVHKVAAHQKIADADSPLEEWCFTHNSFADRAAAVAQLDRPSDFWELFSSHVNSTLACARISREVQVVLLAISRAAVKDSDEGVGSERPDIGAPPPVGHDAWSPLQPLMIPTGAVRWYGDAVVRQVMSWFWQVLHGSDAAIVWVSQFHLYVDFLMSGEDAPTHIDSWKHGALTPHLDLLAVRFQTRARWFNKVLRECLRHAKQKTTFSYCRPESNSLFFHTGCVALPWPGWRLQQVDNWFLKFSPGGFHRSSSALSSLPIAGRNGMFDNVWLTCI